MSNSENVFRRVVEITPDRRAHGGIASVTAAYTRCFDGLAFVETNSRRGTLPGLLKLAGAMLRLPILRLRGRDILHVHSAAGKSFRRKNMLMKWGKLLGYKIIYHNHSGLILDTIGRMGVPAFKKVMDRCDHIVVLSEGWKKYFEKTIGCKNVSIVNNIVETAVDAEPRPEHPVTEFLFMGLLMERKGIFDLLEAIHPLAEEYPERFRLVVGGAHGEEERFRRLVSEPPLSRVVDYVGWLDADGKKRQLDKADAIVLPSYAEGVPITILEGFARGIPAIATTVGGIPDLITDSEQGILLQPGDTKALTDALRTYIEQPQLRLAHGRAAAARVADYLPDAVRRQLVAIFEAL